MFVANKARNIIIYPCNFCARVINNATVNNIVISLWSPSQRYSIVKCIYRDSNFSNSHVRDNNFRNSNFCNSNMSTTTILATVVSAASIFTTAMFDKQILKHLKIKINLSGTTPPLHPWAIGNEVNLS